MQSCYLKHFSFKANKRGKNIPGRGNDLSQWEYRGRWVYRDVVCVLKRSLWPRTAYWKQYLGHTLNWPGSDGSGPDQR